MPVPSPRPLSRRHFLAGTAGFAVLTACGSGDDGGATATTADLTSPVTVPADGFAPLPPEGSNLLIARFPDGVRFPETGFEAGVEARGPYIATDGDGTPYSGATEPPAPESMRMVVQFDGRVVSDEVVSGQGFGEFTPYYAATWVPEQAGEYVIVSDFAPEAPSIVRVGEPGSLAHPHLGDPLPPLTTPTTTADLGFDPICTRTPEPCPFHEVSLDEALAAGGPVALLHATPAYCQTEVCGPSVELLMGLAADFPDVTIVHAEVYTQAPDLSDPTANLGPVATEYQMAWEPSFWVTDASGTIVAEQHWAMSGDDMAAALAEATT